MSNKRVRMSNRGLHNAWSNDNNSKISDDNNYNNSRKRRLEQNGPTQTSKVSKISTFQLQDILESIIKNNDSFQILQQRSTLYETALIYILKDSLY